MIKIVTENKKVEKKKEKKREKEYSIRSNDCMLYQIVCWYGPKLVLYHIGHRMA